MFNWNHKRFPDPKKFFENMNARGINVIPNLKPGILKRHPYIDLFEKNDVFIKTPDGKFIYGYAIANDTGTGMLQGVVDVDLFYDTYLESALNSVRYVDIYLLD